MPAKRKTTHRADAALERRVSALETAVEALRRGEPAPEPSKSVTGATRAQSADNGSDELSVLPLLERRAASSRRTGRCHGIVLVGGRLGVGARQYADVRLLDAADALDAPAEAIAMLLAAIGSEPRVRILRFLLEKDASRSDLLSLLDGPSAGQLYHHLHALQHAGLIIVPRRGTYRLSPERAVPVTALLTLAATLGQ